MEGEKSRERESQKRDSCRLVSTRSTHRLSSWKTLRQAQRIACGLRRRVHFREASFRAMDFHLLRQERYAVPPNPRAGDDIPSYAWRVIYCHACTIICSRVSSTKRFSVSPLMSSSKFATSNVSKSALRMFPVEMSNNLFGRFCNQNDVLKSESLVVTTQLCPSE